VYCRSRHDTKPRACWRTQLSLLPASRKEASVYVFTVALWLVWNQSTIDDVARMK
jgi:hypothetical protein